MMTSEKKKEIKIDIIKSTIEKYDCKSKAWINNKIANEINKKIDNLNYLTFYSKVLNKYWTWNKFSNQIAYSACYLFKKDISKINNFDELKVYLTNLNKIVKDKKIEKYINSILWWFNLWNISSIINDVINQLRNNASSTYIKVKIINNPSKEIFWFENWKRTDMNRNWIAKKFFWVPYNKTNLAISNWNIWQCT